MLAALERCADLTLPPVKQNLLHTGIRYHHQKRKAGMMCSLLLCSSKLRKQHVALMKE